MTSPHSPAAPITDSTTSTGFTKRERMALEILKATATTPGGSLAIDSQVRQAVRAADALLEELNR